MIIVPFKFLHSLKSINFYSRKKPKYKPVAISHMSASDEKAKVSTILNVINGAIINENSPVIILVIIQNSPNFCLSS